MVRQKDGNRRSPARGASEMEEHLVLPGHQQGGYQLRKALERLLRPATQDTAFVEDLLLSASEAFSNAVRYGTGTPADEIRVVVALGPQDCRLTLHYCGDPFTLNPPELPDAEATGGRGRWLMQQLCDSVEYEFRDGMTRVRLIKRWS